MIIRKAKKQDVQLILKLTRELAAYEKLTAICKVTAKDITKMFFGKSACGECFLFEEKGKIVGMAKLLPVMNTYTGKYFFLLRDFMVRDAYRGMGFGKKFMEFAIKRAAKRGYSSVQWAVLDWNKPAISFYKSIGAYIPKLVGMRLDATPTKRK